MTSRTWPRWCFSGGSRCERQYTRGVSVGGQYSCYETMKVMSGKAALCGDLV